METTKVAKQTDLTYLDMSRITYKNLQLKKVKFKKTTNSKESWNLVRVLDDKETNTQAYAFKRENSIVIAYRGTQEKHDWVTDLNYLFLKSNQTPLKTRALLEAKLDAANKMGPTGIPDLSEAKLEYYEKKKLKNAFDVAVTFAEDVKSDFPNATIDTTGHSLGGALATYVRVLATYNGDYFVNHTTTFAAPNVYGLLPKDVQVKVDNGHYQSNTTDYTDSRDAFGTMNDYLPQVGIQHYVDNEKVWLDNHKIKNFSHLFLSDGEIRFTPETFKQLAKRAGHLADKIRSSFREIESFSDSHDAAILRIQARFEKQISLHYDRLHPSDVRTIINKLALSTTNGNPKFYDHNAESHLLEFLHELQLDASDIDQNLNQMAQDFQNKDIQLSNWLSVK